MGLEAFRPLIETVDAVYVSLQYTDATDEIIESGLPVREFLRATRTPDYDDTAGLVAALDYVVGIHTSVHHLAGALGVPATIMVPHAPMWAYGIDMHWYKSKLCRQKSGEEWKQTVKRWVNDSDICRKKLS
jgi:ADP-heptose:LPS heptosyltransferase